ncbi:MAG: TIGR03016 family PEP-CTERM system-associated outer membrane protein [Rhodospirillales bacterium]|nr:MAG: TIGR03016 family PEP-CTERM system-associated outer membrane protein [Rhodospirillales bacterium]
MRGGQTGLAPVRAALGAMVLMLGAAFGVTSASTVALAQPVPDPLSPSPRIDPLYLIAPGDLLEIVVIGHSDLSLSLPVRPDGRIAFPLIGDVTATHKTARQLADELQEALDEFIIAPSVTVIVRGPVGTFDQQIRLVGTAAPPTAVLYRQGITLLDVITEAGGLSPFAAGNRGYIIRHVDGVERQIPVRLRDLVDRGDMSADVFMAPGDVLVVPEGFFTGRWSIDRTASLNLTFTDNIELTQSSLKESALVVSLIPGLRIRNDSARIRSALDVAIPLRQRTLLRDRDLGTEEGFDADLALTGLSTAEIWQDRFFIDARASVSQQARDSRTARSIAGDVQTNLETVATGSITPRLVNRFGGFAESVLSYSLRGLARTGTGEDAGFADFFGDDAETSVIHRASYALTSGRRFPNFRWGLLTSASREINSDDDNISRADVSANVEYPITRSVAALGSVGFQWRDEETTDVNDISAPTWRFGLRYRPSPNLDATLTYGQRDDFRSFAGTLGYQIAPRTRLFASYEERLETSAERFARDLDTLTVDPITGILTDPLTGLPFDPRTDPGEIRQDSRTVRLFRGGMTGDWANNRVSLTGSYRTEDRELRPEAAEDVITIGAGWGRALTRNTDASVTTSFQRSTIDDRDDDTYRVSGRLGYRVFRDISAFASYGFQTRKSDVASREFTENAVTVGVSARF